MDNDDYTLEVIFTRSLSEDVEYAESHETLVAQFCRELQTAFDDGMAGSFQVTAIAVKGVRSEIK